MKDAKKHIFFGFVIAFIVGAPAYLDSDCLFAGIWTALTSSAFAGGVKEWCDNKTQFNEWSWSDLVWTCVGGVIAVVLILLLHFAKG